MFSNLATTRLTLQKITIEDAPFIQELVNTPGWIKFIGDRNVHSLEAAQLYLQKILDNENIHYWVVRLREGGVPIGVITFMIREYLSDYDFGFAFLPEYNSKGFATESAQAVLAELRKSSKYKRILAITLKDNSSSIHLLEKTDFIFERMIQIGHEELMLFANNAK